MGGSCTTTGAGRGATGAGLGASVLLASTLVASGVGTLATNGDAGTTGALAGLATDVAAGFAAGLGGSGLALSESIESHFSTSPDLSECAAGVAVASAVGGGLGVATGSDEGFGVVLTVGAFGPGAGAFLPQLASAASASTQASARKPGKTRFMLIG